MINELMQDKALDHQLNFDSMPSIASLVDETFEEAEASSSSKVRLNDGRLNAPFLLKNARILLAAKDFDSAYSIFNLLIENGEVLGPAYAGIGVCCEAKAQLDKAITAYKEAIIYEPTFSTLLALSDLYLRKNEFDLAIKTLIRAKHLPKLKQSESFEINKNLGNNYLRINQLENAESYYRSAYEIDNNSVALHINIGCLALRKEKIDLAIMHFKEAIRINSANYRSYTGLGLAYLLAEQKDKALDSFILALNHNLQNQTGLFYLIRLAFELEKYDKPIEILEKYTQTQAFNINILYSLAGLYFLKEDYLKTIQACDKLLKLKSGHEGALNLKALAEKK